MVWRAVEADLVEVLLLPVGLLYCARVVDSRAESARMGRILRPRAARNFQTGTIPEGWMDVTDSQNTKIR